MIRLKGQRTDKHREADYPHAVDMPIPEDGMGQNLDLIQDALRACKGGGEQWGFRTRRENGDPVYWVRVGLKEAAAADRIASLFSHLSARRVR